MKNYGLDLEKERQDVQDEDWVFGGTSQLCIAPISESFRESYLPIGEVQRGKQDMQDCASRAPINILETKFNFLLRSHLIAPENEQWLRDNGYITGTSIEFSDAFVAILSKTTKRGNSLKAPIHAIHTYGLIPKKLLPLSTDMDFEDYHDPQRITDALKKLGAEFIKRFPVNYEKVYEEHYGLLLKEDMLVVAGYAWPRPENGIYPRSKHDPNHAFMNIRTPKYVIFDNYLDRDVEGDFIKQLAEDYDLLDYGYRVFLSQNVVQKDTWLRALMSRAIETLTSFLKKAQAV